MKQYLLIFFAILIFMFLGISCGKSDGSASKEEEKIPVEISTVKTGSVVQSIDYNGDIKAETEVKVFSKVPDRISQFFVEEGDAVSKGDKIARIVATTIEQAVKQAEAALLAARSQEANLKVEFERGERLNREDAMSKQQFDAIKTQYESVQAQVEQAQAALASAKSQLNDALLTAPISGIIGKKYCETGDMAAPSAPLVSIVKMDRVKIEFDATEEDIGKLATGQKADIKVRAFPDKVFSGKVYRISPVMDPMTRMAEVEVIVDNPKKQLKPGMYAQVEVTTGVLENVIVVPRYSAIESTTLEKVRGEDQVVKNYYVFIVDSSRAKQCKLNVKYVNHRWLAINSGIEVGDKIVIAGQNNLRDGMAVSVVDEEEKSL
jgi:membrane fusion protein (multidrug efflux system)